MNKTMKKIYMTPLMEQEEMGELLPICNSGIAGSGGDVDAGYGGVDNDGILDPAANERPDFGDDILNMLLQ